MPPYELTRLQLALALLVLAAVVFGLVYADRFIHDRHKAYYRVGLTTLFSGVFFAAIQPRWFILRSGKEGVQNIVLVPEHAISVDAFKGALALLAAGLVYYEASRAASFRPIAERWKRFIGVLLGLAAILAYFNGLRFGYHKYYHRWDQYHYYMGAKYFPEAGYDGLYKCTAIAQDELGEVTYTNEDTGRPLKLDMRKEVRHPDKKIRDLGGTNLLMPVTEILAHPEECKKGFSPERWEEYKADVKFFRTSSDKGYWEDMQKDHGFNPPPVWTIAGKFFADIHPASTGYLQFLASLDLAYLAGMFVAIWWAFGWRVFAVAAIFWGCQSSAPFYWTGGAFLRQDWLFWLVLSTCLTRKRYFALAAASFVYAALLRIFPGLVIVGWLAVLGWQLVKHKKPTKPQLRMLAGGLVAGAVLLPLSIKVCGVESYKTFYEHTLKVHDQTPLTNHMGLRVLVGQKFVKIPIPELGIGYGPSSGRMEFTKDGRLTDPFEVWKRMRNERYEKLKPAAYAIIALILGFFVLVVRRVKSLWIAQCLAQIFVILGSQLTCYYYSFMILGAPLIKVARLRPYIELTLFGFCFLSQMAWRFFYWNDDKYWMLTLLSLVVCLGFLVFFAPPKLLEQLQRGLQKKEKPSPTAL